MLTRRHLGPALAALLLAAPAASQAPDTAALRAELEERIALHAGRVHLSLLDPASGRELVAIRGDEPVTSASIIKVPLLVELYHQVENGRLRLEDPLVLLEADKVGGSGILRHL
ncbi:MAG TPA: serine hydrolase, partial [Longimicrobiales bacterium]|nr:serine hydrolase [Longimicrobiales bacterium]